MLDKQTKRDMKNSRKIIFIFLAIAFPVMLFFTFLLYKFAPSLINAQWAVITLIVVFGLILYGGVVYILKKQNEKKQHKPKKYDPYSD